MANIDDMIHNVVKLDGTYITVHHERCVLVRNRNADCLKCSTVCTTGCITFDGEALKIDTSKCIGCGTCATICPTCCLEAHNPNDAELLARCETVAKHHNNHVCIACARATPTSNNDVARVGCLGRVEETLLVSLAQRGYDVTLVHNHCRNCAHIKGRMMMERVLDTRNKLLDAWGMSAKCNHTIKFPWKIQDEESAESSQNTADAESTEHTQSQAPEVAEPTQNTKPVQTEAAQPETSSAHPDPRYNKVMEDGTLPHFLPDRRERLLDSLASFGEPKDITLETRLWGHVIIDTDICKSCRMCSVFCPTGALSRFDEESGTFGVKHYAGDCIKCRACTEICPAGALTLTDEVRARDLLGGLSDTYVMRPVEIERSSAHTIRDMARTYTGGTQVYER